MNQPYSLPRTHPSWLPPGSGPRWGLLEVATVGTTNETRYTVFWDTQDPNDLGWSYATGEGPDREIVAMEANVRTVTRDDLLDSLEMGLGHAVDPDFVETVGVE